MPSGVPFEIWDSDKIYTEEPNLRKSPRARGGLWIPEESVIDPFTFPVLLLRRAKEHGAVIYKNFEVTAANKARGQWKIQIQQNDSTMVLQASVLINCAGNFGDTVEKILLGTEDTHFHITPRKGQFLVYEQNAANLVSSTILPIPTLRTKGVLVCKSIFGNIIVGPTAEDQQDRNIATISETTKQYLKTKGETLLPGLQNYQIIGMYAGLRPASEHRDYQIRVDSQENYVCVAGIRSTGLTACMGIAEYVSDLLKPLPHCGTLKEEPYKLEDRINLPHARYQNTRTGLVYESELCNSPIPVTHWLPSISLNKHVQSCL